MEASFGVGAAPSSTLSRPAATRDAAAGGRTSADWRTASASQSMAAPMQARGRRRKAIRPTGTQKFPVSCRSDTRADSGSANIQLSFSLLGAHFGAARSSSLDSLLALVVHLLAARATDCSRADSLGALNWLAATDCDASLASQQQSAARQVPPSCVMRARAHCAGARRVGPLASRRPRRESEPKLACSASFRPLRLLLSFLAARAIVSKSNLGASSARRREWLLSREPRVASRPT